MRQPCIKPTLHDSHELQLQLQYADMGHLGCLPIRLGWLPSDFFRRNVVLEAVGGGIKGGWVVYMLLWLDFTGVGYVAFGKLSALRLLEPS
jgi:hypothetical protein